ncbi:MAG: cell division protein FtsH, partial [Proteobacteria bacterium]|nr:cell division protein FtsH [Pseudomonadota bacterium]
IDDEGTSIVTENYARVKQLLTDNISTLHRIAEMLLERESLDTDDIDKIVNGEPLEPLEKAPEA